MPPVQLERIPRADPDTGIMRMQLTSFPLIHYHQYCYGQWITRDAKTILFFEYREVRRDSPIDLWRVNSDGSELALVARDGAWATITSDGETVYYGSGSSIMRVPLREEGAEPVEVARIDGASSTLVGAMSPDGRCAFAHSVHTDCHELVRYDTQTGEATRICKPRMAMHVQLHSEGRLLANIEPPGEENGIWTFSFDGDDFQRLPFRRSTNHFASLGMTGKVVTTVNNPGAAVEIADPGAAEADVLCAGVGFWHPTCDASGEWILADTNWPDTGLHLIHAPSGRYQKLCDTGTGGGHPQWSHAHPRLAPDASYVVYDSDMTGIAQVYAAYIPDEFKAALREG